MTRRLLDDVSRPPPLRVKVSPLVRTLQDQVLEIATRDPVKGHWLVHFNRMIRTELDEGAIRRPRRPRSA